MRVLLRKKQCFAFDSCAVKKIGYAFRERKSEELLEMGKFKFE